MMEALWRVISTFGTKWPNNLNKSLFKPGEHLDPSITLYLIDSALCTGQSLPIAGVSLRRVWYQWVCPIYLQVSVTVDLKATNVSTVYICLVERRPTTNWGTRDVTSLSSLGRHDNNKSSTAITPLERRGRSHIMSAKNGGARPPLPACQPIFSRKISKKKGGAIFVGWYNMWMAPKAIQY